MYSFDKDIFVVPIVQAEVTSLMVLLLIVVGSSSTVLVVLFTLYLWNKRKSSSSGDKLDFITEHKNPPEIQGSIFGDKINLNSSVIAEENKD